MPEDDREKRETTQHNKIKPSQLRLPTHPRTPRRPRLLAIILLQLATLFLWDTGDWTCRWCLCLFNIRKDSEETKKKTTSFIEIYQTSSIVLVKKSTEISPFRHGLIRVESKVKIESVSFKQAQISGFDITSTDVIVFLHIQKTGGTTFGRHLVRDLNLETPCICPRKRKRCDCFRPNTINEQWLFSRYSTGWKCGLHADWTELTDCVEGALDEYEGVTKKRRYFFITVLRDPIHRYLSEFRHVQRGATWKSARHWCGGQEFTSLPHCYKGSNWTGVELDEFMNCPYNLAHNRQTRMLADLTLAGCYTGYNSTVDQLERDRILLQSAKQNLASMTYFGLTEQQSASQYIFEQTFQLDFVNSFDQANATLSAQAIAELTPTQIERIRQLNSLDAELLDFARQLLQKRFELLKGKDPNFRQHWLRIVHPSKSEATEGNSLF
uniref:Heparan-sulfate 6-O-sulfotransferase n=1 Tax=Simocephalus serrulatus TaxID=117539 RepID=A0A4Y7NPW5_9CRUS|nr:EOG090X0E58 [Simocephalus serrulatus]SVE94514.1 EOG090X0E58 [Simocephalus serrulatus]